MGVVLGNLALIGFHHLDAVRELASITLLAEIGVLFLLFSVGHIFASIGATLTIAGERVVDDAVFSGVVLMVALTTLLAPPLLQWRVRGKRARS